MNIFKQLQTLTETPGPSGFESEIGGAIQTIWEPLVDEMHIDRLGNLIALKNGTGEAPRRKLLIASHMDEIGLMVHRIEAYNGWGFLRVTNLGGVDIRHLYGQLVTVHGKKPFPGVIGSLPAKMLPPEKRKKPFGYDEILVDVGQPMDEVEAQISVGDIITFRQPLRKLLGKRISGKSLDNRASVTAVTLMLEQLQSQKHSWDIIAVATTQEEVGLRGAYTSSFASRPDAAIAIDVTFGKGPGVSDESAFELGGGPVLDLGPNVHPGVFKSLQDAAERLEMKVHVGTHTRASGTDGHALQVARSGVPTGILSIPLRYMHTMVESLDTKDIKRSGRLLAEFVSGLDDGFLDHLAKGMMEPA